MRHRIDDAASSRLGYVVDPDLHHTIVIDGKYVTGQRFTLTVPDTAGMIGLHAHVVIHLPILMLNIVTQPINGKCYRMVNQ